MQQQKPGIQITQAFLFFNQPFTTTNALNHTKFEKSVEGIRSAIKYPILIQRFMVVIVERYYEIVTKKIRLQEYLLLNFVQVLTTYVRECQKAQSQLMVICLWGCVSHLQECTPQKKHKSIIKGILGLMESTVKVLESKQNFNMSTVFPKLYSFLINYVVNPHKIDHIIYGLCLGIIGNLLVVTFKNKREVALVQRKQENSFDNECVNRLQMHIMVIVKQISSLELTYKAQIIKWLNRVEQVCVKYSKLLCPFYILSALVQHKVQNIHNTTNRKIIQSAINKYYIQLLQQQHLQNQSKLSLLKRIQNISKHVKITKQQHIQTIMQVFINKMYKITNHKNLVHMHNPFSTPLIQLSPHHSFSTYNINPSALVQSFDFECERILVTNITYAQSQLQSITSLKNILINIQQEYSNSLLQYMIQNMFHTSHQYMVDMSITLFCQYLTKILIIYWILKKPNYKPSTHICETLFGHLTSSQAIKILSPSFQQQQMLIGLTLSICAICYHNIINNNKQLKPIQKLKRKLCLVQLTLNNIAQNSFMIKLITYNIMIVLAAPNPISQLLNNLQTTLINRNTNNITIIINIIKYCELTNKQCQNIVDKFMFKNGNEQLLRVLLPKLNTVYIRKCVLSASKWHYILINNTKYLLNKQLEQGRMQNDKGDAFYMNDGSNVIISNALGVVVLELASKWQGQLFTKHREIVIDLLIQIAQCDGKLVFLKGRFNSIMQCLYRLLREFTQSASNLYQRIQRKIYKLLSILPEDNYKIFYNKQPYANQMRSLVKSKHKKIQLLYLTQTNPENEVLYNYSEKIIQNLDIACT